MLGMALIGILALRKKSIYGLKHERTLACGCIYIWMAPTSLLNDLRRLLGSWARANEPVTLQSQCAKQTLALPQPATLLTPRKYDAVKENMLDRNTPACARNYSNTQFSICVTLHVESLNWTICLCNVKGVAGCIWAQIAQFAVLSGHHEAF